MYNEYMEKGSKGERDRYRDEDGSPDVQMMPLTMHPLPPPPSVLPRGCASRVFDIEWTTMMNGSETLWEKMLASMAKMHSEIVVIRKNQEIMNNKIN